MKRTADGIARLAGGMSLNPGALAMQAACLAAALAAYFSVEANVALKALVGVFAYGLSDAKLYAFLLVAFLSAGMFHLRPRPLLGRRGLACLFALPVILYAMDAAQYAWMVDGLGGGMLSKYYAVSGGHYSSTWLMHIHNGKAAAHHMASLFGLDGWEGGYDVGAPYAGRGPGWIFSAQSLAYVVFLALALLAVQDLRVCFGADVVSVYVITAYAVAKTSLDGGPFMHEAVVAYPVFAAAVAAAYAAGPYGSGGRRLGYVMFHRCLILMLALSVAAYVAFLMEVYGRVLSKGVIYPHYWLTEPLSMMAAAYLLFRRPGRAWQAAALVLAAAVLLAPPIGRNLKSQAALWYEIPAGTEAGVMHPAGGGRLSTPHYVLGYEVIGGYVVETVRLAAPASIMDMARQTGDYPGYDHVFYKSGSCSDDARSLHLVLHTRQTPPSAFSESGFVNVRGVRRVGAAAYALDAVFTNCAPNPMFLLAEYLSDNGMRDYVLENGGYRPVMGA